MRTSLRSRLYLLCFGLTVLLSAPAFYGLGKLAELRDIAFDLQSQHAAAFLAVGRLQTSVSELNRLERSYVVAPTEAVRREMLEALEMGSAQLYRLEASGYGEAAVPVTEAFEGLARSARHVDSLLREGRMEAATAAFQAGKPQFAALQEALGRVAAEIDRRSTQAAIRAEEIGESAARTTTIALLAALVFALILGAVSVGALTSPLRRLREAMAKVAGGDFVAPDNLSYGRTDEVGDLSRSFRSMTVRLAELDRLKAEFVSMASHELKTPVSVIRGYTEMMEDGFYGPVNEKQRRVLGYLEEQTAVLTERVNQLLSLSRFEALGFEIIPLRVELEDFLAELEETFQAMAAQKEVRFEVRLEPAAPDTVWMDPDRVRNELLGNLLANAFKFTPAGGEIAVSVLGEGPLEDRRVVFEVRDSGEGIPTAQLPYVFEKYYQAGPSAGKVGAGLGLAIAREIVHGHGGEITVRSEAGEGTTFRVTLPVRPPASARGREDGAGKPGAEELRRIDVGAGRREATVSAATEEGSPRTGTRAPDGGESEELRPSRAAGGGS